MLIWSLKNGTMMIDMVAERDKLNDLYKRFYHADEEHHGTLNEKSDIVSSEYYLQNVQNMDTLNL